MQPWRRGAIVLLALATLAWTAYCGFWLVMIQAPPIEGAADQLRRTQLGISVVWAIGMTIAMVVLLGLWRRTFDAVPRRRRVVVAAGTHAIGFGTVAALWAFDVIGLLIFAWIPLAGALLLVTAWASTPVLRRRLGQAFAAWFLGVAVVGLTWFVATDLLRNALWQALGLVTLAAVAWWLIGALRDRSAPSGRAAAD